MTPPPVLPAGAYEGAAYLAAILSAIVAYLLLMGVVALIIELGERGNERNKKVRNSGSRCMGRTGSGIDLEDACRR